MTETNEKKTETLERHIQDDGEFTTQTGGVKDDSNIKISAAMRSNPGELNEAVSGVSLQINKDNPGAVMIDFHFVNLVVKHNVRTILDAAETQRLKDFLNSGFLTEEPAAEGLKLSCGCDESCLPDEATVGGAK